MEMWFITGKLLEKNLTAATQRRYKIYYITAKYDPLNGVYRIVFCNRNGKEVFYNNTLYFEIYGCITAARRAAFHADIRFVMPELE